MYQICYNKYMNSFITFEESQMSKDLMAFKFAEDPFVISVVCEPLDEGFTAEWMVSGIRRRDDKPRFLLRLQMGVSASRNELLAVCHQIWDVSLRELALHAANQGGLDAPANSMKRSNRDIHAEWHVRAHDRLLHFNPLDGTLTERTANMFNLLKSMGFVQAPSLIVDYEAAESLGMVKPSTVNRRLHMARQAGLIPNYTPSKDIA
jgi:hypothetical protein